MKVVTVRFKDVDIEEILPCHPQATIERWSLARGTLIEIEVPSVSIRWALCDGPHYVSSWIRKDGIRAHICPHIAEIGD